MALCAALPSFWRRLPPPILGNIECTTLHPRQKRLPGSPCSARRSTRRDIAATLDLFAEDCYWRDLVAFTWNVKTMEGKAAIAEMLQATLEATSALGLAGDQGVGIALAAHRGLVQLQRPPWGRGSGIFTLEGGKCRTILTTLQSLDGHEEALGPTRPKGVRHGADRNRKTWAEARSREEAAYGNGAEPYCLVIGGGQGGIMLGARLKQLGVPTVIVEKNAKAGDSWRNRYRSLVLHDPVWYDHLPYLPFPAELAGLHAQGQDGRLAGDVRQGDGADLLGRHRVRLGELRRGRKALDGRAVCATASR